MIERIGRWLARRTLEAISPQELEERVEAVVQRVDGLEDRVQMLEEAEEQRSDAPGK